MALNTSEMRQCGCPGSTSDVEEAIEWMMSHEFESTSDLYMAVELHLLNGMRL